VEESQPEALHLSPKDPEEPRPSAKSKKKKTKGKQGGDLAALDPAIPKEAHSTLGDANGGASTPQPADSKSKPRGKGKGKVREEQDVDEILRQMEQLDAGADFPGTTGRSTEVSKPRNTWHLLGVDVKHLKAEDELRRIFGSKVISSVEAHERGGAHGGGGGRRHRMSGRGRGRGGFVGPRKGGLLISPMDHWPRWDGGILMESVGSKEGCPYFRYTYLREYMRTQAEVRDSFS
jgi:hypothetical protein